MCTNSNGTTFLYSFTTSTSDIKFRNSSVGSTSVLLPSDLLSDPRVCGLIPALTTFFSRVFGCFQGFQPFVFLESYINT